MKTTDATPDCNEFSLCWTMRFIGLVLLAGSLFFLYKDLSLSMVDNGLFTVTSLLGLLTIMGSWTSTSERTIATGKERSTSRKQKAWRQAPSRLAVAR
jgi:hypothetical protein